MLYRIVKMEFHPEYVERFITIFDGSADKIRAFDGCLGLELLQEAGQGGTFFTFSKWENEESLNQYRASELFKGTWAKTKVLFSAKPQAWSTRQLRSIKKT